MSNARLIMALAVMAAMTGAMMLYQPKPEPAPAPELAEEYECTTCDARAASKARQREALQNARAGEAESQ